MDREIDVSVRRQRLLRRILTACAVVAGIVVAFLAIVAWLSPSVRRRDLQIARVTRGNVDATVQASGVVVAEIEKVVSSPVEARVLRIDHRAGDRVRAGDELLALDNLTTRLELERTQERLAKTDSEAAQLRLENEDALAAMTAELEQKKLDAEILRLKAEQTGRLRAEGLTAEQDALVAITAAKKISIEIAQLEQKIVRARRTAAAKVAAATLDANILRKERDESQRQLDLSMMRSDRNGVVTWMVQEEGATVRRGDMLARIADLSSFRVDATISDLHASELAAGMPVRVRVDDTTFLEGTISSIEPRIENGAMRFRVALGEPSNGKLRNNLRVDVFPVTGRRENALRLNRGALGQGDVEDVYVVRGEELVRVSVHWGLAGQQYIEPLSGLREGDAVVISNMNDYAGVKTLRLR